MSMCLGRVGLAVALLSAILSAASGAASSERAIAVEPGVAQAAGTVALRDRLLALFGAKADALGLEQIPPSPVRLGTANIRFRVTPTSDGFLVLLSVTDEGEVVQLFPTVQSERHGKSGAVHAGHMLTVPDASYGVRIDARTVTKGTVLAIITRDPLPLSKRFVSRAIAVVPSDEVAGSVLPELIQVLGGEAGGAGSGGGGAVKSVATLRYEIVP
jgi:hypothetical protein